MLRLKLSAVALFILLSGCSQYQIRQVVNHPGNYEVIKLGNIQVGGDFFRATQIHDKIFYSYSRIFGPSAFSAYLLEYTQISEGETVLDIGTGSGVQAIYAAEKAKYVLATDIDQLALKNTMLNAKRLIATDNLFVRKSDLFNALKDDEKFDVIIASIPYAWNEETQHRWELHERFFGNVSKHLNPKGRIYFLTGRLKNLARTRSLIQKNKLKIVRLNMDYASEKNLEPMVYLIQHKAFFLKKSGIKDNPDR